jgi:hypothetical protein
VTLLGEGRREACTADILDVSVELADAAFRAVRLIRGDHALEPPDFAPRLFALPHVESCL